MNKSKHCYVISAVLAFMAGTIASGPRMGLVFLFASLVLWLALLGVGKIMRGDDD